jgi:hypothetical protein
MAIVRGAGQGAAVPRTRCARWAVPIMLCVLAPRLALSAVLGDGVKTNKSSWTLRGWQIACKNGPDEKIDVGIHTPTTCECKEPGSWGATFPAGIQFI